MHVRNSFYVHKFLAFLLFLDKSDFEAGFSTSKRDLCPELVTFNSRTLADPASSMSLLEPK